MEYTYELLPQTESTMAMVKKTDEAGLVWFIPTDPANSDYQAYLKSLEENN